MEHFLPFNELLVNGDLADKQKAQAIYEDITGGYPVNMNKLRSKSKKLYRLVEDLLME